MEAAAITKQGDGRGLGAGPERGAVVDLPIRERVGSVPAAPMQETAGVKGRDLSTSGAGPERGGFAAIPGRGRVRAETPSRRGETWDRP